MAYTHAQVMKRLNKGLKILNVEEPFQAKGPLYLGIDLGTADVVACVVDQQGEIVALFLEWASVVKDGVVVDYMGAIDIVRRLKEKAEKRLGVTFEKASTSFPPQTDARLSTNIVEAAGLELDHVMDEPSAVAALLTLDNAAIVDIGGGTTGVAVIEKGKVIFSADDATGGHHLSLTIAGNLKKPYEEAELLKRKDKKGKYLPIVRPVLERMADIIHKYIKDYTPEAVYLTGGTTAIAQIDKIFKEELDLPIIIASQPLLLTPYAIACLPLTMDS